MKKFLYVTLKDMAILALGLVFLSASRIQADPWDDFNFSLHSSETRVDAVMSEVRVAQVLSERMDLFPRSQVPKLARHLLALCEEYRFDPAFILSLIEVESRFRMRAVSPVGAVGLMQMMPGTAQVLSRTLREPSPGKRRGGRARLARAWQKASRQPDLQTLQALLKDPFINLELGIAYLAELRDRYRGLSPYYVLAAYNLGPGRMDELLLRKDFKPVNTKRYYESIRRALPKMREYRPVSSKKV